MGVMRATRGNHRIVTPLALAFALATIPLPAAAQSGSEAVVCVGSERRTLATNPIRRVYTEDMEVVYRIGADIGQRDQVERDLSSDLGSYLEVWCAWSDPGDDHAVIISYTGVIRQDLTVDPEDPRFQALSVGFGEDFDEAETRATTISQRFSSQSDGSGYEVLLRETWGVAEGVVAGGAAPEPDLPDGPICTGSASSERCWMEVANHSGCFLWNPEPRDGVSVIWSGECSEGFAEGRGDASVSALKCDGQGVKRALSFMHGQVTKDSIATRGPQGARGLGSSPHDPAAARGTRPDRPGFGRRFVGPGPGPRDRRLAADRAALAGPV